MIVRELVLRRFKIGIKWNWTISSKIKNEINPRYLYYLEIQQHEHILCSVFAIISVVSVVKGFKYIIDFPARVNMELNSSGQS